MIYFDHTIYNVQHNIISVSLTVLVRKEVRKVIWLPPNEAARSQGLIGKEIEVRTLRLLRLRREPFSVFKRLRVLLAKMAMARPDFRCQLAT